MEPKQPMPSTCSTMPSESKHELQNRKVDSRPSVGSITFVISCPHQERSGDWRDCPGLERRASYKLYLMTATASGLSTRLPPFTQTWRTIPSLSPWAWRLDWSLHAKGRFWGSTTVLALCIADSQRCAGLQAVP